MIETLIRPQPLDNDVTVMKVLQLMGQLSLHDIEYLLKVTAKVYQTAKE